MKFTFSTYNVINYEESNHHIFLQKDFENLESAINHLEIKDTINHNKIEIDECWKDVNGKHANILVNEYKVNDYTVIGNWIRIEADLNE